MEIITEYVKPELLVVSAALYFLGVWLKKIEKFPDKYIPFVLSIIGIILSCIWVLATSQLTGYQSVLMAIFTAIVQGILVAAASTHANQLWKQSKKEE